MYLNLNFKLIFFLVYQVLTKDSVTVAVDAVVYYRIQNATMSITNVEDSNRSTRLLAATTLRNVLGTKNLSEILSDRESISHVMQVILLIDIYYGTLLLIPAVLYGVSFWENCCLKTLVNAFIEPVALCRRRLCCSTNLCCCHWLHFL